jgi:hypothetical protein
MMGDRRDPHVSELRKLMSEAPGTDYESFVSLAEAQAASDAFVVLEGDDGGQIYAAFPATSVQCSEDTLLLLLRDLDAIAWPGSYEDSARVVYERRTPGSGISGGMGRSSHSRRMDPRRARGRRNWRSGFGTSSPADEIGSTPPTHADRTAARSARR